MKTIVTEIEIGAPRLRVWQILSDFARYPEWNPFIPEIQGALAMGNRLRVRLQPPGSRGMIFRPKLLQVMPLKEIRWRGSLMLPGLFDGEHAFLLEKTAQDKIRFIHRETFTGILLPMLWPRMAAETRAGFEQMNEALKARAEDVHA